MVKFNYLLMAATLPSLLWSAQEQMLNEQQRLEAFIAKAELNRIAVQGDRIQQVFGADGQFILETEEQSGQIFVKPLDPSNHKPVNLTLVTEGGLTQDLKLVPRDGEAENVLLKSVSPQRKAASLEAGSGYVDNLLQLIKGAAAGSGAFDGHSLVPCENKERAFTPYLTGEARRCWAGPRYKVLEYKITNISSLPQTVDEASLVQDGDLALAVGAPQLAPSTATNLIVIRLK